MKIVVDIDNTLCVHRNRDYVNAVPVREVIEKVNALHNNGVEICLYTSRGMNSCKGDIHLIKEKNEQILLDWLKRNGVKYDSLIFGKPLGDYYVDDGGMSVGDFLSYGFTRLDGNSASSVIKFGRTIVKEAKNANFQYYWYEKFEEFAFSYCKVPCDRLLTLNTIKMEYVDGNLLCDEFSYDALNVVLNQVLQFKQIKTNKQDVDSYLDKCSACYSSKNYDFVIDRLRRSSSFLVNCSSFCHGDLSFSNIIISKNGVYLIDPNDKEYSSYLLDLAKLRCSFDGLEYMLGYDSCVVNNIDVFDFFVKRMFDIDKELIIGLEITRFARILPYMKVLGKINSEELLKRKIEELCEEIVEKIL